jgi:hypothetical protein
MIDTKTILFEARLSSLDKNFDNLISDLSKLDEQKSFYTQLNLEDYELYVCLERNRAKQTKVIKMYFVFLCFAQKFNASFNEALSREVKKHVKQIELKDESQIPKNPTVPKKKTRVIRSLVGSIKRLFLDDLVNPANPVLLNWEKTKIIAIKGCDLFFLAKTK